MWPCSAVETSHNTIAICRQENPPRVVQYTPNVEFTYIF